MRHGPLSLARSSFSTHPSLPLNPRQRPSLLPNGRRVSLPSPHANSTPSHTKFRRYCASATNKAASLELPLLPFELEEALIPSETKTLHLYEARFLALLDEAVAKRNKTFVHYILDPLSYVRSSFESYCCLIRIEDIKMLPIGALVSIRGISRVKVVELLEMEPYLRGVVVPVLDHGTNEAIKLDSKILELRESMSSLQALQIKLRALTYINGSDPSKKMMNSSDVPKGERLQTKTKSSLLWADNERYDFLPQDFVPRLAERISFAAFQPVSGMSDSELLALRKEKLKAMDSRESLERVERAIEFVGECMKMVAARLAIQSL